MSGERVYLYSNIGARRACVAARRISVVTVIPVPPCTLDRRGLCEELFSNLRSSPRSSSSAFRRGRSEHSQCPPPHKGVGPPSQPPATAVLRGCGAPHPRPSSLP